MTKNHPGFSDMVKDGKNGLLIPKDNVPALAKAIACLLADPGLRQQTGMAGRALIESQFANTLINDLTFSVYESAELWD